MDKNSVKKNILDFVKYKKKINIDAKKYFLFPGIFKIKNKHGKSNEIIVSAYMMFIFTFIL